MTISPKFDGLADAESETVQALVDGASITVDWSLGRVATVTLGGARVLGTPTNASVGWHTLIVKQDATGDRSLDFPSVFPYKPEIKRLANETTVLRFWCDGTNYHFHGDPWVWIPATADATDSTPTDVTMSGARFTPIAGADYEVLSMVNALSNAATTGVQWRIDPGNATGSFTGVGGGSTTATSLAGRWGSAAGTTNVLGLSNAASGWGMSEGHAALRGHATSPTAVTLVVRSELAGNQITAYRGVSGLRVRRLQ